jgi:hypothetical protein
MTTELSLPASPEATRDSQYAWRSHAAVTQFVAGWRWISLIHVGEPNYLVTLKLSPAADEDDAVSALEWWLKSPGREDGDVVEVA